MSKKNRGFTLIELLAVIVILAIIATIATPIVLGIIDDTRKSALKETANNLLSAADQYALINYEEITGSEIKSFTIDNSEFVGDEMNIRGKLPKEGTISIAKNGNKSIAITDGKWCVTKNFSQNKVEVAQLPEDGCIVSINPVCANADELGYVFDEITGTIIGYFGDEENIIIPSSFQVDGTCYDVLYIDDNVFEGVW